MSRERTVGLILKIAQGECRCRVCGDRTDFILCYVIRTRICSNGAERTRLKILGRKGCNTGRIKNELFDIFITCRCILTVHAFVAEVCTGWIYTRTNLGRRDILADESKFIIRIVGPFTRPCITHQFAHRRRIYTWAEIESVTCSCLQITFGGTLVDVRNSRAVNEIRTGYDRCLKIRSLKSRR